MLQTEPSAAMRVGGDLAQRFLLRTGAGESGEPRRDATIRRVASGPPTVWKPAAEGAVAARGSGDQPQTCCPAAGVDGDRSGLSQAQPEPTRAGASDLPLLVGRAANQRSGPGLVQRYYLRADGQWVHVFG